MSNTNPTKKRGWTQVFTRETTRTPQRNGGELRCTQGKQHGPHKETGVNSGVHKGNNTDPTKKRGWTQVFTRETTRTPQRNGGELRCSQGKQHEPHKETGVNSGVHKGNNTNPTKKRGWTQVFTSETTRTPQRNGGELRCSQGKQHGPHKETGVNSGVHKGNNTDPTKKRGWTQVFTRETTRTPQRNGGELRCSQGKQHGPHKETGVNSGVHKGNNTNPTKKRGWTQVFTRETTRNGGELRCSQGKQHGPHKETGVNSGVHKGNNTDPTKKRGWTQVFTRETTRTPQRNGGELRCSQGKQHGPHKETRVNTGVHKGSNTDPTKKQGWTQVFTRETTRTPQRNEGEHRCSQGKTITLSYKIRINWCKNPMNYYQLECRSPEGR